ncbi:SDR family NAD(P)-dependent oxidoreductase [Corynebacterium breve]|uniref:SDR family NAD(P)-dependent oxidoreductase n=1 Tax=Corynebacterium breve TaxID=3049799 RepID=A0ABY8VFH3_9CORY|nr:SDR family NAD(P)-dependent oxidoreductase [Corynebacterium breve]WIM67852.1 SDR family NAD(P)-dependent oxidoreductase [Corynebacterium breve]
MEKIAVVTGGSEGIGEAAARALAADGWKVYVAARSVDKLEKIAEEIGGVAVELDVTSQESVDALAAQLEHVDLLVNNAGGARGLDYLRDADLDDWQWMYDVNVVGLVRVTKALYPKLIESEGLIINLGSIAGFTPYVGGSGYNAAKHGVRALTRAMRLEEVANPVRITEIDPGRVKTDFSVKRFKGDEDRANQVYDGKLNLTAEDVAEAIRWVASLPVHVNIDTMNIMPRDQA